jgi:hypothetical protein
VCSFGPEWNPKGMRNGPEEQKSGRFLLDLQREGTLQTYWVYRYRSNLRCPEPPWPFDRRLTAKTVAAQAFCLFRSPIVRTISRALIEESKAASGSSSRSVGSIAGIVASFSPLYSARHGGRSPVATTITDGCGCNH